MPWGNQATYHMDHRIEPLGPFWWLPAPNKFLPQPQFPTTLVQGALKSVSSTEDGSKRRLEIITALNQKPIK